MMFVSNKIHAMKQIGAETFNNGAMDYRHPVEYDDDDTGLSSGWRFINSSFMSKTMVSPPRIREKDLENSTPEEHSVKENRECVMLEDESSLNDEKISQDVANIVEVDIFGGITENGDVVCNIEALLAKYERQHPNLYSNRPTSAETTLFEAGYRNNVATLHLTNDTFGPEGKLNQSVAYPKECTEDYTTNREPITDEGTVNEESNLLDKISKDGSNKSRQDKTSVCEQKSDEDAIISQKKKSVHFALEDQVNVADRYIGHIGQEIDRDNIFVRVEKEYKKKKPGEISLKKGMKLKQKRAPTCGGMSYGWAKKYVFSPKKYGFFPVDNVSLV